MRRGRGGAAGRIFVAHVRSRMRRVICGHDHPYVIFENFGSWQTGDYSNRNDIFQNTEAYLLHSLGRLAEFQKATGCRFDAYSIEFWLDPAGDLNAFNRNGSRTASLRSNRRSIGWGLPPVCGSTAPV